MPKKELKELKQFTRDIDNMKKAIRQFGDKDLRREMTKASRDATQIAVPYVQKYVPQGETGNLHRNIKAAGTRTEPKIRAGTKTKGGPYAWLVHRGHAVRGGGYVPATNYMRKGLKEAFPKVKEAFRKNMQMVINRFNSKYGIR